MPTLSARTVHVPETPARLRRQHVEEPLYYFEIELTAGQIGYIVSDPRARASLPAGAVVLDAVLAEGGLPTITETPGFTSGKGRISGGTYTLVDDRLALGIWLAEKNASGESITNAIFRQYSAAVGEPLLTDADREEALDYTFQVSGHRVSMGGQVHEIDVRDIRRNLDVEIFPERGWRLYQSITDDPDLAIPITLDIAEQTTDETLDDFLARHSWLFEHGPDYLQDPGLIVGYGLIQDGTRAEVFSHRGLKLGQIAAFGSPVVVFDVVERGVLGTIPYAWEVDEDTAPQNRLEIAHFPYFEEDPLALIVGIATGRMPDGRPLPEGDYVGIDEKWVAADTFTSAGDTARRTVRMPKTTKAQTYIESELLAFMPGVMMPGRSGALEYRGQQTYGDTGTVATVTARNIETNQDVVYEQDQSGLAMPVHVWWDYDPILEEHLQKTTWHDEAAIDRNRTPEPKTYKSSTISTGATTEPALNRFAGILFDRHRDPVPRIRSLSVTRELWWVPVGSQVMVSLEVYDHVNGSGLLNYLMRPMTVVTRAFDQESRSMVWGLAGALERSADLVSSEPSITREMILENAIRLEDVPGITVLANGQISGTPTLVLGQKYAHVDRPCTLTSAFNPTWTGDGGDFELWTEQALTIACELDLTAAGNRPGGAGGTATQKPGSGSQNLFNSRAAGSLRATEFYRTGTLSSDGSLSLRRILNVPPAEHRSAPLLAVRPQVSVDGDRLVGMPVDLSGSGGAGGGVSTISQRTITGVSAGIFPRTVRVAGGDGGAGGAGAKFVCPPGSSIAPGGRIITNGGDADSPPLVSTPQHSTFGIGASGAAGRRGGLLFLINGRGTAPAVDSDTFHAFNGRTFTDTASINGETRQLSSVPSGYDKRDTGAVWKPGYDTEERTNLWLESHDIQFLPPRAVSQESLLPGPSNEIASILALQKDQRIKLIPTLSRVAPSDGQLDDFAIAQADIDDLTIEDPPAFVLTADGWESLDWTTANNIYSLILESKRKGGGDSIITSETRPQNEDGNLWHNPLDDTIVRLLPGGPPDYLVRASGARVSDNRALDPGFLDGTAWYVMKDIDELPTYPSLGAVGGVNVNSSSVSVAFDTSLYVPSLGVEDIAAGVALSYGRIGNGKVVSYVFERDGVEIARRPASASGYFVDETTTAGQTYTYTAHSVGREGRSRASSPQTVTASGGSGSGGGDGSDSSETTLTAPTNGSFQKYSSTNGALRWTRVPDSAVSGTGHYYEIERVGHSRGDAGTKPGVATNSFEIGGGLEPDTNYAWRVRLRQGSARSAWLDITGSTS